MISYFLTRQVPRGNAIAWFWQTPLLYSLKMVPLELCNTFVCCVSTQYLSAFILNFTPFFLNLCFSLSVHIPHSAQCSIWQTTITLSILTKIKWDILVLDFSLVSALSSRGLKGVDKKRHDYLFFDKFALITCFHLQQK